MKNGSALRACQEKSSGTIRSGLEEFRMSEAETRSVYEAEHGGILLKNRGPMFLKIDT
jgi:hypothetical protein